MKPEDSSLFVEHGIDTTFVTLQDERILEERHIKELEKSIIAIVEEGKRQNMTLNFSNVRFMSSGCLGLLVKIHKRIREKGGNLKLCNISPDIYKVFEITQLYKVFDIA